MPVFSVCTKNPNRASTIEEEIMWPLFWIFLKKPFYNLFSSQFQVAYSYFQYLLKKWECWRRAWKTTYLHIYYTMICGRWRLYGFCVVSMKLSNEKFCPSCLAFTWLLSWAALVGSMQNSGSFCHVSQQPRGDPLTPATSSSFFPTEIRNIEPI